MPRILFVTFLVKVTKVMPNLRSESNFVISFLIYNNLIHFQGFDGGNVAEEDEAKNEGSENKEDDDESVKSSASDVEAEQAPEPNELSQEKTKELIPEISDSEDESDDDINRNEKS